MLELSYTYKHLSRKGFCQGWAVWHKGRERGHSQCKRWETLQQDLKGEQEVPPLNWTKLPASLSEHTGTSGFEPGADLQRILSLGELLA